MDSTEGVRSDSGLNRGDAHAALVVSIQSVAWTVVSSIIAITLGILENSAVLVAFGAIGCVDAIGSLALVHHFRHGLRNDELSDHLELVAHRVVLVGLLVVGCAAIIGGAVRLALGQSGEGATPAVVLASGVARCAPRAGAAKAFHCTAGVERRGRCPMRTSPRSAPLKPGSLSSASHPRGGSAGTSPMPPQRSSWAVSRCHWRSAIGLTKGRRRPKKESPASAGPGSASVGPAVMRRQERSDARSM